MSYILFAWATSFLYATSAIIAKLTSKHRIANPWLFNFVWTLAITIFSIPFALSGRVGWPTNWGSMLVVGVASTIAGILYILAMSKLDVSVLNPLYSFRTPMSVILGFLIFHELLSPIQLLLIAVITLAGVFVSMDERFSPKTFFHSSIALALFAVLSSSIYGATVKYVQVGNGYWEAVLWTNVINMVLLVGTIPLFWKELKKTPIGNYNGVILSGFAASAGGIAAYKAFAVNLGISTAIVSLPLSMVMAFAFSVVAPKLLEKHPLKVYAVRFAAATVMFLAALGLSR